MATPNKFGRIPIGYARPGPNGFNVFPTAAFQVWLDELLSRTGGVDSATLTSAEYDTYVGAPIQVTRQPGGGGPVSVSSSPTDSGPVPFTTTSTDGGPI